MREVSKEVVERGRMQIFSKYLVWTAQWHHWQDQKDGHHINGPSPSAPLRSKPWTRKTIWNFGSKQVQEGKNRVPTIPPSHPFKATQKPSTCHRHYTEESGCRSNLLCNDLLPVSSSHQSNFPGRPNVLSPCLVLLTSLQQINNTTKKNYGIQNEIHYWLLGIKPKGHIIVSEESDVLTQSRKNPLASFKPDPSDKNTNNKSQ